MTTPVNEIRFLFDVDNALLNNDCQPADIGVARIGDPLNHKRSAFPGA
jgi:hypothetical protein